MENDKKEAIIIFGAPGSGKGTQGELLEKEIQFKRYIFSDLIKKQIKPNTKLYTDIFVKGKLLNDLDVFEIFLKSFHNEKKIILDGIPRTKNQAYWLYGFFSSLNYDIKLIYLSVNEKNLINRITARYYCPKCHSQYSTLIKEKFPQKEGYCDIDGEKLIQRKDDTKEVFNERIKIFDEVKKIILNIYKNNIIQISGDDNINKVHSNILLKLEEK